MSMMELGVFIRDIICSLVGTTAAMAEARGSQSTSSRLPNQVN